MKPKVCSFWLGDRPLWPSLSSPHLTALTSQPSLQTKLTEAGIVYLLGKFHLIKQEITNPSISNFPLSLKASKRLMKAIGCLLQNTCQLNQMLHLISESSHATRSTFMSLDLNS